MEKEQPRQSNFDKLCSSIQEINYFKQNGWANKGWYMFHCKTIGEARDDALEVLREARNEAKLQGLELISVCDDASYAIESLKSGDEKLRLALESAGAKAASIAIDRVVASGKGITAKDGPAKDAGRDAAMMAQLTVLKDLGIDFEGRDGYLEHFEERMKVWKTGCGVAGDIGGVPVGYREGIPYLGVELRFEPKDGHRIMYAE